MKPPQSAIDALLDARHADPFSLLGPHDGPGGTFTRAILPGAEEAVAYSLGGGALGGVGSAEASGFADKPAPTSAAPAAF